MPPRGLKTRIARRRAAVTHRYKTFRTRGVDLDVAGPAKPLVTLLAAYGPGAPAPDVLHLGGSESEQISYNDWSKKPLTVMLRKALAPRSVCSLTNTAYNPEVYAAILHALEAMPGRPKVIIVPAVLRMGSPLWDRNPTWRFDEDRAALEAYAADPTAEPMIVPAFASWLNPMREARDPVAWQAYRDSPVNYPGREERTVGECLDVLWSSTSEERERLGYLYNFVYEMDDDHRRPQALAEVFRSLERLDVPYVSFFHPQNHEKGRRLVGPAWDEHADLRVEQLQRVCGPTARFHDWKNLLPADCFYDSVEHWDERGRRIVVAKMVEAVEAAIATTPAR